MKKFFFMMLVAFAADFGFSSGFLSFRGIDFHTSLSSAFTVDDFRDSKIKVDSGLRMRFSNLSAIFSLGLPDVRFADFPSIPESFVGWDSFSECFTVRWGLFTEISPGGFPLNAKLYLGNLSFGRSISRLKSPTLSAASALSSSLLPGYGIGPSLPGFSSSEKPVSVALCVSPAYKISGLPSVQISASVDKELFCSVFKNFTLPGGASCDAVLNAGSFIYGDSGGSSWFLSRRPFVEDRYFSASLEMFLTFPSVRLFLCAAACQSPFGGFSPWSRGSLSLVFRNLVFNSAFYVGDPSLITASGGRPGTWCQVQLNPWARFSLGKTKVSTGLFFQGEMLEPESSEVCPAGSLVFRWDGKIKGRDRTNSASAALKWTSAGVGGRWTFSAGTSVSFRHSVLTSSSSLSYKFSDGRSTISLSLSMKPKMSLVDSVAASFSTSIKTAEILSSSARISLDIKKRWKFCSLSGKMAFSLSF